MLKNGKVNKYIVIKKEKERKWNGYGSLLVKWKVRKEIVC
jgi:hypothetical protein